MTGNFAGEKELLLLELRASTFTIKMPVQGISIRGFHQDNLACRIFLEELLFYAASMP
jgi:hypothetical protein